MTRGTGSPSIPAYVSACLVALCLLLGSMPAQAMPRLATLDWTLAETLVALGAPPQGVAQRAAYHTWVGEPALPDEVVDLGLRTQPNLELLSDLAPAYILVSPMFANLVPRLERIAPVKMLSLYSPGQDTWDEMLALTREIGELTGREDRAEQLIDQTRRHFEQLRQDLPADTPPLLMVQFMDARHVRVFGANGLFDTVLERLGLENAWKGPTNAWGFSLVGIEALASHEDARLVVVDPVPVGVERQLAQSGLWRHLPSVRNDDVVRLPPTWSFGALPSARRFATLLSDALGDAE